MEFLIFAQNNEVCHRDLNPENILLANEKLKLGDFGWNKFCSLIALKQDSTKNQLKNKVFKVKNYYCAPEISFNLQRNDSQEKIDQYAANIYSFGLILASLFFNTPILEEVAKLHGKKIQNLRQEEAFIMNKQNKVVSLEQSPSFKICGPFDESLQSIISQKLSVMAQTKELIFLKSIMFQMLNYNPTNRITLKEIKQQLTNSGLIHKNENKHESFVSMRINLNQKWAYPLISDIALKNCQILKKICEQIKQNSLENTKLGDINENNLILLDRERLKQQWMFLRNQYPINFYKKDLNDLLKFNTKIWQNSDQKTIDSEITKNCYLEPYQGANYKAVCSIVDYGDYLKKDYLFWSETIKQISWNEMETKKAEMKDHYLAYSKEGDYIPNFWRNAYEKSNYFEENQLIIAREIVQNITLITGYRFEYCLKMLYSNLWNIEKSCFDLLY